MPRLSWDGGLREADPSPRACHRSVRARSSEDLASSYPVRSIADSSVRTRGQSWPEMARSSSSAHHRSHRVDLPGPWSAHRHARDSSGSPVRTGALPPRPVNHVPPGGARHAAPLPATRRPWRRPGRGTSPRRRGAKDPETVFSADVAHSHREVGTMVRGRSTAIVPGQGVEGDARFWGLRGRQSRVGQCRGHRLTASGGDPMIPPGRRQSEGPPPARATGAHRARPPRRVHARPDDRSGAVRVRKRNGDPRERRIPATRPAL